MLIMFIFSIVFIYGPNVNNVHNIQIVHHVQYVHNIHIGYNVHNFPNVHMLKMPLEKSIHGIENHMLSFTGHSS